MNLGSQPVSKAWVVGLLTVSDLFTEWAWRVFGEFLVAVSWSLLTPMGWIAVMTSLGIWAYGHVSCRMRKSKTAVNYR
jgi:hypothetical protein